MQALLEHFITQYIAYALIVIALVAFFESLALVGLILPGTMMMAGLGVLIGSGKVNFWQAWMVGIIGCLLGDWISFWLGWRFKKLLYRSSFIKKNRALLDKAKHALHRHSMFTVLLGRFIGPIRPLIPMVAGMLDISVTKFIIPSIVGCLFWPPFYFLSGILAGAVIDLPANKQKKYFQWLLLITILLLWLVIWLYWCLWQCSEKFSRNLLFNYLFWLAPFMLCIFIIMLIHHPLTLVYGKILLKIVSR